MALFAGELNPVAPKAQKKVPLPDGLDLDAWINDAPSESSSDDENPKKMIFHEEEQRNVRHRQPEMDEDELARPLQPFTVKNSTDALTLDKKIILISVLNMHLLILRLYSLVLDLVLDIATVFYVDNLVRLFLILYNKPDLFKKCTA
eukprot:g42427.t1